MLTFTRSLQVDTDVDLKIALTATEVKSAGAATKLMLLAGIFGLVAGLMWLARRVEPLRLSSRT